MLSTHIFGVRSFSPLDVSAVVFPPPPPHSVSPTVHPEAEHSMDLLGRRHLIVDSGRPSAAQFVATSTMQDTFQVPRKVAATAAAASRTRSSPAASSCPSPSSLTSSAVFEASAVVDRRTQKLINTSSAQVRGVLSQSESAMSESQSVTVGSYSNPARVAAAQRSDPAFGRVRFTKIQHPTTHDFEPSAIPATRIKLHK